MKRVVIAVLATVGLIVGTAAIAEARYKENSWGAIEAYFQPAGRIVHANYWGYSYDDTKNAYCVRVQRRYDATHWTSDGIYNFRNCNATGKRFSITDSAETLQGLRLTDEQGHYIVLCLGKSDCQKVGKP